MVFIGILRPESRHGSLGLGPWSPRGSAREEAELEVEDELAEHLTSMQLAVQMFSLL